MHSAQGPGQSALSLSVRETGTSMVISVIGEVDLDNVGRLSEVLERQALGSEHAVVLDLSGVTFADSTTVNAILRARRDLGPRLRLAALSPYVERLVEITGIRQALPVYGTVDEALQSAPA
ncbi:STAS domain-containing protein [Streptomyces minutiscleroticus]|uniref:Anti-sigma factor antagonist n=1 Tax=Streptomyces minutiscleroticus TaxID=68238 RepID=A0A918KTU1_9ACTN|nr:STAS domain-containing protein [Streptomyces minutiscleroticus]GGX75752.1 hypothetical protein GCM10010358_32590 [Streptomyces minutiscleroticus]